MSASDMNRVVLIGRLTRDPEIKQIPSGASICTFSLASNYTYGAGSDKKEIVSYFNCLFWGKGGEVFAKWAEKGQQVSVDGRLQQRRWEDNDGKKRQFVEVVVDNFQFLSSNKKQEKKPEAEDYGQPPAQDYAHSETFANIDIPF